MEKKIAYLIIAGLWIYILLRAILVPIGIDEANTFFHYVLPGEWLPGQAHWDANNHLLNSALSIVTFNLFGADEWSLRLPNVLAGLLYLVMSWKLAGSFAKGPSKWALFIALISCSFMLDYFGYMRGYGLSFGLLLTAIWLVQRWKNDSSWKTMFGIGLALSMMVYANLSTLISALLIISLVIWFARTDKTRLLQAFALVAGTGIVLSPAVFHSFNLKDRGLLYHGEGDSFWSVTVESVARNVYHPYGEYLVWIFPIIMLFILGQAVSQMFKKGARWFVSDHPALLPLFLLVGNLFANVSMHWLLGVNYPSDRVALFYVPLLYMSLFSLSTATSKNWVTAPLLAMVSIAPIHLLASANLSSGLPWEKSQYLPHLMEIVYHEKSAGPEPTLEGDGWRNVAYDYHNWDSGGALSSMRLFNDNGYLADIVITNNENGFSLAEYEKIDQDPWSDLGVYQRKKVWERNLIEEGEIPLGRERSDEFLELVNLNIKDKPFEAYLFQTDITFTSSNVPVRVSVIGQVSDADHAPIDVHELALDRTRQVWDEKNSKMSQQLLLDARSVGTNSLKVFFWNRNNDCSYTVHGKWKLFGLS